MIHEVFILPFCHAFPEVTACNPFRAISKYSDCIRRLLLGKQKKNSPFSLFPSYIFLGGFEQSTGF